MFTPIGLQSALVRCGVYPHGHARHHSVTTSAQIVGKRTGVLTPLVRGVTAAHHRQSGAQGSLQLPTRKQHWRRIVQGQQPRWINLAVPCPHCMRYTLFRRFQPCAGTLAMGLPFRRVCHQGFGQRLPQRLHQGVKGLRPNGRQGAAYLPKFAHALRPQAGCE